MASAQENLKKKWVRGFRTEGLKGDLMQRYFSVDEWEKFQGRGWRNKKERR
jgi:hypothetical protein